MEIEESFRVLSTLCDDAPHVPVLDPHHTLDLHRQAVFSEQQVACIADLLGRLVYFLLVHDAEADDLAAYLQERWKRHPYFFSPSDAKLIDNFFKNLNKDTLS